ncbi:glycoside hydrolase family 3 N-terminal domain-containing protein (plasmid) [Novosphingobium sp. BL-8A]|uniref:glycoside hydrolase family 3 N-terminal domain-containing protein n=1 Tax=Novosphingobium sp. BL-8A TaxID=3127639 RepID=UPI0037582066
MMRGKILMRTMLLLGAVGVVQVSNPIAAQTRDAAPAEELVKAKARALLARMTPEEKAAQIVTYNFSAEGNGRELAERRAATGAGSFLFVSNPEEANRLQRIALSQSRLKIPLIFGFDVVHGLSTIFPVPIAQAASWDPVMIERNQAFAAAEARAVGIQWTFAPMVDIARDPRWGRMVEGAGEDPFLASAIAAAQVHGFQGVRNGGADKVIATPKHFAGYGAALGGRDYDEADLSDSALWNVYFPPFKSAIDAGAGSLMSAYMGLNGIPATGNRWLLTDVLRKTWGFKGWVVSDGNSVLNLAVHGMATDTKQAAAMGLEAGVDMEMTFGEAAFANLPSAVAEGRIDMARLDEAVERVLEAKIRLGLFERPFVDVKKAASVLRNQASLAAARVAAERSAVLLKNDGGLLPLDRKSLHSIAVIGGLADSPADTNGPWVFAANAPASQSILEGIRTKAGPTVAVRFAPGVKIPKRINRSFIDSMDKTIKRPEPADDDSGIDEAVAAAEASEVAVVVLGEPQNMVGEMASQSNLDFPGRQLELLGAVVATGKPVVVVLINGRPLDLKGSEASAVLDMWYPGSRGGEATANLLFGEAVPGGKLPFTWPRNVGQVPLIYAHLASHEPTLADRRYSNETNRPVYPFGFGLSYSTFAYSNIKVDRSAIAAGESVTVTTDVTNTGKRTADEVVQLYLHQRSGTSARPVRELKGFTRVTLGPGERRTIAFRVGPAELRYWNAGKRDWTIDASTFDVAVGTDSTSRFGASFAVTSTK